MGQRPDRSPTGKTAGDGFRKGQKRELLSQKGRMTAELWRLEGDMRRKQHRHLCAEKGKRRPDLKGKRKERAQAFERKGNTSYEEGGRSGKPINRRFSPPKTYIFIA